MSGAAAFIALWATLPGWRYLAMVATVPGVTLMLEYVYRGFLHIRPQMQGLARAFEAPKVTSSYKQPKVLGCSIERLKNVLWVSLLS